MGLTLDRGKSLPEESSSKPVSEGVGRKKIVACRRGKMEKQGEAKVWGRHLRGMWRDLGPGELSRSSAHEHGETFCIPPDKTGLHYLTSPWEADCRQWK